MKRSDVNTAMMAYQSNIERHNTANAVNVLVRLLGAPGAGFAELLAWAIAQVPQRMIWTQERNTPRDYGSTRQLARINAERQARTFAGNFGEPTPEEVQMVKSALIRLLLIERLPEAAREVCMLSPKEVRLHVQSPTHLQTFRSGRAALQLMLDDHFNISNIEVSGFSIERENLAAIIEEFSQLFEARF